MENKKPWWQDSLYFFGTVSGWIAGPVVVALFVGKYLDKKFGTTPWLFLSTIAIAFLISVLGIWREIQKYMKRVDEESKKKKNGTDGN